MPILSGQRLTPARLNPALATVRQTVAQTFTSSTWAAVNFDAEDFDTHGGHSTTVNNSRYTCQVAGYYQLSGGVSWASSTSVTRWTRWAKNGTELDGTGSNMNALSTGQTLTVARTITVSLNVGDYVQLQGAQFAGANLDTYVGIGYAQPIMSVTRVSS